MPLPGKAAGQEGDQRSGEIGRYHACEHPELQRHQPGKPKQEGLELKTHDDGKAEATGIPYGKVRIQVIAPGFRTYGEDFSIDQPNLEFTIKLQKPTEQLSIYK